MNKTSMEMQTQDYRNVFLPRIHRIGTVIMLTLLVITFMPPVFLSLAGHFPGWPALGKIFATMFGMNVYLWIVEPVLFYPLIGATGLYLAGIAGNIANMRFPASLAAQDAVNAEKGTLKAEMASVIGIVGSVIVNLSLLILLVIFSSWVVSILPQAFMDSTKYVVPSVFGGIMVMIFTQLGIHKLFIRKKEVVGEDN